MTAALHTRECYASAAGGVGHTSASRLKCCCSRMSAHAGPEKSFEKFSAAQRSLAHRAAQRCKTSAGGAPLTVAGGAARMGGVVLRGVEEVKVVLLVARVLDGASKEPDLAQPRDLRHLAILSTRQDLVLEERLQRRGDVGRVSLDLKDGAAQVEDRPHRTSCRPAGEAERLVHLSPASTHRAG